MVNDYSVIHYLRTGLSKNVSTSFESSFFLVILIYLDLGSWYLNLILSSFFLFKLINHNPYFSIGTLLRFDKE